MQYCAFLNASASKYYKLSSAGDIFHFGNYQKKKNLSKRLRLVSVQTYSNVLSSAVPKMFIALVEGSSRFNRLKRKKEKKNTDF